MQRQARNGTPALFAEGHVWIFSGNGDGTGRDRSSDLTRFTLEGVVVNTYHGDAIGRGYHSMFSWNRKCVLVLNLSRGGFEILSTRVHSFLP